MWKAQLPTSLVVALRGVGGGTTEDHHLTLRPELSNHFSYSGVCSMKHSSGLIQR